MLRSHCVRLAGFSSVVGRRFVAAPGRCFAVKPTFNGPNERLSTRFYCEKAAETPAKPKAKKYDYWKLGFIDIIRNPTEHKDLFYYPADANVEGHNVCVVYDRNPKAKKHLLVLPTMLLQKYKQLNETHISLLEEMKERAEQTVRELKQTEDGKDLNYKIGFQAVPGMLQIHLHVISDDFESPYMKNKRHWNTYNTDFFVSPDLLISQLKQNGSVQLDEVHYNTVIKQPLACPKCGMKIPRLPDLMVHLEEFHNAQ